MILKYTLAWAGLVVIGVLNGVAREAGYGRFMGELAAHRLSTLTAVILSGLYTWGLTLQWEMASGRQAAAIGLIWFFLTMAFEFLFGRYVMKLEWDRLLGDYNLSRGRVWGLFLLWIVVVPWLAFRWQS
ncbi:hypothetical protein DENIS_2644 [Desulfonema ishimotonii]|uniref:Uncharacterized protein n=1 Tax=Desulfonema ishimotonii TaxID=45657 RepID=A0A401FXF2_9BACT|nr:hypothetical protein [Desulfonema ishimotonii]GBC61682.1 hypothetical protein DENIS_2644 [Desulfonema ishimotonii]